MLVGQYIIKREREKRLLLYTLDNRRTLAVQLIGVPGVRFLFAVLQAAA